MAGLNLWISFLVMEDLNNSDQFILGCDNCAVMIHFNIGLMMTRNPDRKYVKRPVKWMITDEKKIPILFYRKRKIQPGQAVIAFFSIKKFKPIE